MEIPTTIITRPPTFTSSCVLLIDDEPQVLSVGRAVLVSQGFEVACAASGDQAVELLMQAMEGGHRFAACVLDLTMPGGLSGFDVLDQLHQVDPALPVIASSGYFQEDARDLCQSLGFYDILAKPYTPDVISTLVRRAIAGVVDAPADAAQGEAAYAEQAMAMEAPHGAYGFTAA
ncbi:MAG: response regulator [Prosthecobacter sp.]|jgi:CheY-like chemotaxis protein